jgi:hypothetical protein
VLASFARCGDDPTTWVWGVNPIFKKKFSALVFGDTL